MFSKMFCIKIPMFFFCHGTHVLQWVVSPKKFKTMSRKFTIKDPAAFKSDEVITSKNKCTIILFDTVQIEQNMSRISELDPEAT